MVQLRAKKEAISRLLQSNLSSSIFFTRFAVPLLSRSKTRPDTAGQPLLAAAKPSTSPRIAVPRPVIIPGDAESSRQLLI